jgi:hypothetical protein
MGRAEVYTGFWWGKLRENSVIDRWIMLRWIFRKWSAGAWNGSIWLRIETGGGHLQMRQ